jgi:hypothetical protein
MLEFLFELLGELLLQVGLELLVEWGLRPFAEPFRARPKPWLASIGYLLFGALMGGLSLLVLPHSFIAHHWLRVANVFVTPLIAGLCMALLGGWRRRRGQSTTSLDRFSYGFLFAISMAVVRYFYAT